MVSSKKIDRIETSIYKNCTYCSGEVCSNCRSQVARIKSYARSNIPMDYWMLPFKNFEGDPNFKKLIVTFLSDIDKTYDDGASLAFVGNLGTGKTYAACSILKMALTKDYSVAYLNMSDIIEKVTDNDRDFYNKITNTDFVCIDEYDARWVYPSEKAEQLFGQTMERILRERFQNKMPTILCSNTIELNNVLSGDFSKALDSLFSNYLKVVYVSGKDFRKL